MVAGAPDKQTGAPQASGWDVWRPRLAPIRATRDTVSVRPETRYAKSGDVSIAYQVLGEGPFDLVFAPGFVSNVEFGWEEPTLERFYRRLASFCRLIIFDKRGTGVSDRISGVPDLETRMDDVRAIMDAVGSERAAVLGYSEGAAMAALFAATYPERTPALVLYGTFLTWEWLAEGREPYLQMSRQKELEDVERRWGTPEYCDELLRDDAPSKADDDDFRRWYATRVRLGASPAAAVTLTKMNSETDARPILASIHVPTLIVHRVGDRNCDVRNALFAAEQIPGAVYVELPGEDHLPWVGDSEAIVEEIERFLTGIWESGGWEEPEPERVLSTVLFTDIVRSSERAASLGDRAWRELLGNHHTVVRRQLARFRGREMDAAGDGFFASFDGPARAIRCACAIVESMPELGLEVRAGLHTGECELMDDKVAGIAVHTGARVASHAEPGEVLVSSTVKDLVAGSGIAFDDRGERELKGISGAWRLYAVAAV
jgi:pimeloyl-ACP methyl ester carboxylesterase/class 3 adenylate cyclase